MVSTGNIIGKASEFFHKKESEPNSEVSKASLTLLAAANMKKTLQSNINRVDLLTDTKIGEIKSLMTELAE